MFDRVGEIIYPASVASEEEMLEAGIECGATNVESGDEIHEITCDPDDFSAVSEAMADKFGDPEKAGLAWRANVPGNVDEDNARTVMKLIDALEDNDDVQNVTTNLEVGDDVLERIMNG
jgi:transcriptional/translational regulatory protein YebC/TACO1